MTTLRLNYRLEGQVELIVTGDPDSIEQFFQMTDRGTLELNILTQSQKSLLNLTNSENPDQIDLVSFAIVRLQSSKIIKNNTNRKKTLKYDAFRAERGQDSGLNSVILRPLKGGVKLATLPQLAQPLLLTPYTAEYNFDGVEYFDLPSFYVLPRARKDFIKIVSFTRQTNCGIQQIFDLFDKNGMDWRFGKPDLSGYDAGNDYDLSDTA